MAFYISGPKLLFETTEISTHPNSTQPEIRDNESQLYNKNNTVTEYFLLSLYIVGLYLYDL
jgi:hypothetical protein